MSLKYKGDVCVGYNFLPSEGSSTLIYTACYSFIDFEELRYSFNAF
jgi:hypothetical protein